MKDKIIEILKQAYLWGRDNGEGRSEKNFNDFLETSTFKDFIDSLYPTLNRDKVDAILYDCFRFSDHYGESAKKASDALCSLSLPTQKRKDPVDPLDSYYLKDGKWHCVECDKPMNLPTLSEGEMYDKALLKYPRTTLYDEGKREGYIAALKELTKPKEE
jgi:tRNA G10  N-methylase Trm11